MVFIHDTRDKPGKHDNVEQYLTKNGHSIVRSKLYCGDISLLNNQSVCIDLKKDLQEVYSNVIQDHVRFKAEILRATAAGIRLIILVEQEGVKSLSDVPNWKNPRVAQWHKISNAHKAGKMMKIKISSSPPANSLKLAMTMTSLANRYGVEWQFCDKSETGKRIVEILGGG